MGEANLLIRIGGLLAVMAALALPWRRDQIQ